MRRISRLRHWRADLLSSFEHAAKLYDKGQTDLEDWRDLYKLAPGIAAKNRGVTDPEAREMMYYYAIEGVEHNHRIDPKNKEHVLFHFTSAYIDAHVAAGILGELEGDKVMHYLNENIDLFPAP
ncbi:MAG: hypothetical protein AAF756_21790 [Pseudomonadota bacterium]